MRATFWAALHAELAAGHAVFLAIVTDHSAHSPGSRGAMMLVSASGRRLGTIGGGVMELKVEQQARALLADPPPSFFDARTLHHDPRAEGERSGMICAGWQRNLYRLCVPAEASGVAEIVAAFAAGERDAWLVIGAEGLGLVRGAQPSAGDAHAEPIVAGRRVAIFGGGHCGQALARQMLMLDWHVELFETRAELATGLEPALRASWRRVGDFREAASTIAAPASTAAVVMTTDFPNDVRALVGLLPLPLPFVGLMGSAAKIAEIRRRLGEEGFEAAQLESLVAPVGLAIGARKPGEIAVSVAAQLLAWATGRES